MLVGSLETYIFFWPKEKRGEYIDHSLHVSRLFQTAGTTFQVKHYDRDAERGEVVLMSFFCFIFVLPSFVDVS